MPGKAILAVTAHRGSHVSPRVRLELMGVYSSKSMLVVANQVHQSGGEGCNPTESISHHLFPNNKAEWHGHLCPAHIPLHV